MRRWVPFLAVVVLGCAAAMAQSTVKADQGRPGNQGPWPVTSSNSGQVTVDGGFVTVNQGLSRDGGRTWIVETSPSNCWNPTHSVTTTGVAAANCPAAQLANRCLIMMCNSSQNSGSPLIKIRIDGTNPVMAVGNVGDVLSVGQCITYGALSAVVPKCISDTATTYLTALECACP